MSFHPSLEEETFRRFGDKVIISRLDPMVPLSGSGYIVEPCLLVVSFLLEESRECLPEVVSVMWKQG